MIAVIFEVWPRDEHKKEYLDLAAEMRTLVEQIDGFISVERFESIYEPGKLLSLSIFRDEKALDEWRKLAAHRRMQSLGRSKLFADYRLRIAGVMRDYGMTERDEAPEDSLGVHS